MNREAAWAVKPFPAAMADMFPCLEIVMTVIRVYGT